MSSGALVFALLLISTCCPVSLAQPAWGDNSRGDTGSHSTLQDYLNYFRQKASGQSASQEGQCGLGQVYEGSLPTGQTKVDFFDGYAEGEYSGSIAECAEQCCKLGKDKCQYAWIFNNLCFVIGCTEEHAWKCAPSSNRILSSTYAAVITDPRSAAQEEVSTTTLAPVTTIVQTSAMALTTPPSTTTPPPPSGVVDTPTTASPKPPRPHPRPRPQPGNVKKLTISFAGDTDLTLPTDSTRLFASTWPPPSAGQKFVYQWEKLSGPDQGSLEGIDKDQLHLTQLVAGTYVLKLTVQDWRGGQRGVGVVNVTVQPPQRKNAPPTPIIKPSSHTVVTLPSNSALFDASSSEDDSGSDTLHFHWEEVEGPVGSQLTFDDPVLQLSGLKQGNYRYKLTVTDQDGLSAVTFASVIVNPEPYYPPQALAGKDQLLKLPNTDVTLDGSKSTAFKGKLQFSWEKLAGRGSVDMKGTDTPYLHLHITSTGDYLFRLTVTDSTGQASSANVSVVVTPEHNLPPVAYAGPNVTVVYPHTEATLDGRGSYDDFRIDNWQWTQLSGPEGITMSGEKTAMLKVKGLHIDEDLGSPTVYQFQLCVWDYHNLTDTSNVTITYKKNPQVPPNVVAGGDVNITLPQNAVILNGSNTYDDFGILSYKWVRSESSPASGLVINGSDSEPILMLSNLVQGTYHYSLTVRNKEGVTDTDNVTIQVLPDPLDDYLMQVQLDTDPSSFTLVKQRQLERVLSLILDDYDVDYQITVVQVLPAGPNTLVEFYAVRADNHAQMNATDAYFKLTDKGQDYYYPHSDFHFVKINMKVCRLPCSGRGSCDRKTHRCSCMRYWMENPLKANFGKKETNCDWSIFYVSLAVLLSVAVLLFLLWLVCCCCMRKRRRARTKRRVRYAILDRKDGEEGHQRLLRDQSDYQQTSLMVSGSETEEEILFESSKKDGEKASVSIRSNRLPNGKTPVIRTSPNHREDT